MYSVSVMFFFHPKTWVMIARVDRAARMLMAGLGCFSINISVRGKD